MHTPFSRYEGGGRRLLGKPAWGNGSSRRGYGLAVFDRCGTGCVYCGYDMGSAYEAWLNLSIDHVIPGGDGRRLDYPTEWVEDIANLITCCRACNEFLNGYRVTEPAPLTVEEFFTMRDRHFERKREWVLARHAAERSWYDSTRVPPPASTAG